MGWPSLLALAEANLL